MFRRFVKKLIFTLIVTVVVAVCALLLYRYLNPYTSNARGARKSAA